MSNNKNRTKSLKEISLVFKRYKILTGFYNQRAVDLLMPFNTYMGINKDHGIGECFLYIDNKIRKYELLCPACYTEFFKEIRYKDTWHCINGHSYLGAELLLDQKEITEEEEKKILDTIKGVA